jgi:DnaJ-class molecular chaperone
MDLPVTIAEAALGAEVTIPTPDGKKARLKIAPGTLDGKVFRLKGKGATKLKGAGKGDLKVKARIAVPQRLTAEEKELLEQFAQVHGDDVRAHLS